MAREQPGGPAKLLAKERFAEGGRYRRGARTGRCALDDALARFAGGMWIGRPRRFADPGRGLYPACPAVESWSISGNHLLPKLEHDRA
jgi:hypothetical protein